MCKYDQAQQIIFVYCIRLLYRTRFSDQLIFGTHFLVAISHVIMVKI